MVRCAWNLRGAAEAGGTFRPFTPAFSEFQVNSKKIMQQRVLIFPVLNLVIKLHKLQCLLWQDDLVFQTKTASWHGFLQNLQCLSTNLRSSFHIYCFVGNNCSLWNMVIPVWLVKDKTGLFFFPASCKLFSEIWLLLRLKMDDYFPSWRTVVYDTGFSATQLQMGVRPTSGSRFIRTRINQNWSLCSQNYISIPAVLFCILNSKLSLFKCFVVLINRGPPVFKSPWHYQRQSPLPPWHAGATDGRATSTLGQRPC